MGLIRGLDCFKGLDGFRELGGFRVEGFRWERGQHTRTTWAGMN